MKLFVWASPFFGHDHIAVVEETEEKARIAVEKGLTKEGTRTVDELSAWREGKYEELIVSEVGEPVYFPNS